MSLYSYTDIVSRYAWFLGQSPDTIINGAKARGNIPDPLMVQNHLDFLESCLASLRDDGLSLGRVYGALKHVRRFYHVNGVKIELSEPLSRRVTYKDRSPTLEELMHVLNIVDLREKVIVTMLALGGFRDKTLIRLQYRHVREDLGANRISIHVHVEADIRKVRRLRHVPRSRSRRVHTAIPKL